MSYDCARGKLFAVANPTVRARSATSPYFRHLIHISLNAREIFEDRAVKETRR